MRTVLLDTGPIVASLVRDDPQHGTVCEHFDSLSGLVVTTGAVVTESMFFLQDVSDGPRLLTEWLRRMRAEVVNCFDPASLQAAAALMERYADTPMEFADATLVAVAGELDCGDILTLDVRGFRTYRCHRSKKFKLLLQDG